MTDERRVEVAAEALYVKWLTGPTPTSVADLRDLALADARAVVAALDAHDGDLRHPNGLRYVNPRGNGPSDAERHPSAVTYAERMAELARITADTTTGDEA